MLDKKLFSERFKIAYWRKGWTRQETADEIGISYDAMGDYERGERLPRLETLAKMSKLFGVSIDWLLGLEEES
jgi:transcriptional regulator with XRE-family HTH domain